MAHLVEIIETMSYNPSASTSQQPANTAAGGAGGMSMSVGMGLSSSTSGGVNDNRVGAARLSAAHKEWVLGYFEKMAGEMRGRIGVYRARIAVCLFFLGPGNPGVTGRGAKMERDVMVSRFTLIPYRSCIGSLKGSAASRTEPHRRVCTSTV
jgi:hypothetical protein